ncbi:uncharacterized protein ACOB8E_019841 isoform 1-T1 [Sarcophilus harrisii]
MSPFSFFKISLGYRPRRNTAGLKGMCKDRSILQEPPQLWIITSEEVAGGWRSERRKCYMKWKKGIDLATTTSPSTSLCNAQLQMTRYILVLALPCMVSMRKLRANKLK